MKAKQPNPRLNRQILEEASDWFVDFRVGDVDASARERFDLWLRQSPEHIRAYMEIANTYVVLPAFNPTRQVDVQQLIAYARFEGNIVPFDLGTHPDRSLRGASNAQHSLRTRGPRILALAASIALAGVAAASLAWLAVQWRSTYATDTGERRSITLADGSTIDLNARSKVRIEFSKAERDVELLEGQALFEVAKDKARPFIVRSGAAVVRAVGTQFDVYRKKSGTTVTVVEGRVAVFGPTIPVTPNSSEATPTSGASGTAAILLSAGEQVTVTAHAVAMPQRTNIAAATAWTQHHLIFDATPLGDVVDDFNRYNTRQIRIEDPALDDFHISGVYASTDPASLIRFLRQQPGIDVVETDEGVRITHK